MLYRITVQNGNVLDTVLSLLNNEPNLLPQNFRHGPNNIVTVPKNIFEKTVIAYLPPGMYEDAYHNNDAIWAHTDKSVYK